MNDPSASQRRYECRSCGVVAYSTSMTGRVPLYCPDCRPRTVKRGGTGGAEADAPAYRLALAATTLRLGLENARQRLLEAHLDPRATDKELRRAIADAIGSLNDAETVQTSDIAAADLHLDVSSESDSTTAER